MEEGHETRCPKPNGIVYVHYTGRLIDGTVFDTTEWESLPALFVVRDLIMGCRMRKKAEAEGFEPPVPFGTTVFKTAAIDHSATPPERDCKVTENICFFSFSSYFCLCMRKWLTLILFAFLSLAAWAQTDTLRLGYSVRGRVKDAQTGRALESVHVSVPGRHYATVTNADGEFVLKSDTPIDAVLFTFLGYKSQRVSAKDQMSVALVREAITLPEALIIGGDPIDILQEALSLLPETYCPQPELLECFYRETVQKRSRYTYVAEAVARLYRDQFEQSPYNHDASALEKSRLLVSQRRSDTLSVKTQGGPQMALNCDFLKNPELLFSPSELNLYRLEMQTPVRIGDRLQYVIRLTPAVDAPYALYHALVYIDRENLTFTRIEASLDMSDRSKAIHAILVSKPMSLRFFPEEASVVLNYRPVGNKIRLEYFRSTIRFACDWRKRLFKTHYTAVNELVVTDVRPEAVPISRKERFRTTDYLNDKAQEFLDPDFWKDYNIIEPSESLEHAINRLKK